jgi:hypothetical protein
MSDTVPGTVPSQTKMQVAKATTEVVNEFVDASESLVNWGCAVRANSAEHYRQVHRQF